MTPGSITPLHRLSFLLSGGLFTLGIFSSDDAAQTQRFFTDSQSFDLVQMVDQDLRPWFEAVGRFTDVDLNRYFTRPAEETKATSLPLKVGPAAYQAARLIIQVRQFDLQPALRRRCTFPKYFED